MYKMIKRALCLGLIAPFSLTMALADNTNRAHTTSEFMSDQTTDHKTLVEEVTGIKKKTDKFNLFLNMQGSGDLNFNDGFDNGQFTMRQFRIEAKGNITPWLSYRWRQRLNRGNDGGNMLDNMPTSIDIAGIGVNLSDKFSLFAGKQCAAYGGIEFDLNPIEIYEYSDMIDNMSNFLTGINLSYNFMPMHQLNFQVLNSRNNKSVEAFYGVAVEDAKMPLLYTLNWNGNFADIYKTRWSASYMQEAKGEKLFYLALGNQLDLGNFSGFFDFMYSNEDLDRKGIMSSMINAGAGDGSPFMNAGARYTSYVMKLNYRFNPKWNAFVKGMFETAELGKNYKSDNQEFAKGTYRNSFGYFGGVEYYPMADSNLHFFLTYVGRSYKYKDVAKEMGFDNYNTDRLSIGFIYQLPLF